MRKTEHISRLEGSRAHCRRKPANNRSPAGELFMKSRLKSQVILHKTPVHTGIFTVFSIIIHLFVIFIDW